MHQDFKGLRSDSLHQEQGIGFPIRGNLFSRAGNRVLSHLATRRRERSAVGSRRTQIFARQNGWRSPNPLSPKYEGGERRLDVLEFITIAQAMGAEPTRFLKALIRRIR
jgi:hypothetical protein